MSRTYDVYFPEDPECPGKKIPHDNIKLPIQTARQKQFPHLCTYEGKVFYDSGTKKGEDPEDPDFFLKPGEWVVKCVTENNNFVCIRKSLKQKSRNIHFMHSAFLMSSSN